MAHDWGKQTGLKRFLGRRCDTFPKFSTIYEIFYLVAIKHFDGLGKRFCFPFNPFRKFKKLKTRNTLSPWMFEATNSTESASDFARPASMDTAWSERQLLLAVVRGDFKLCCCSMRQVCLFAFRLDVRRNSMRYVEANSSAWCLCVACNNFKVPRRCFVDIWKSARKLFGLYRKDNIPLGIEIT